MKTIKVWDLFVRVFHWSLAAAVISQLATAEDFTSVHATVGYAIIALMILRIIWGFVGSKHARFTDFIYPPADIHAYLKGLFKGQPRHYIGHNPAGGTMVCILLFFLVLTTLSGLLAYGAEGKGPLGRGTVNLVTSALADGDRQPNGDQRDSRNLGDNIRKNSQNRGGAGERDRFWKEIHESLVGILIFLAGVHVCGVIASSYVHKENLILAMVTGKKNVEQV
jgi:cytochrome b